MEQNGTRRGRGCPCAKQNCPRHGDCAACRAYHAGREMPPSCVRRDRREKRPAGKGSPQPGGT